MADNLRELNESMRSPVWIRVVYQCSRIVMSAVMDVMVDWGLGEFGCLCLVLLGLGSGKPAAVEMTSS
jgi:hypothetical protein